MNKYLINKFLALALIMVSVLTPVCYPHGQTSLVTPVAAFVQDGAVSQEQAGGDLFVHTKLFFGRNKPDGTKVSRREWERFLDEIITPRFPDGLTVLEGIGRFLNSRGEIEQERAIVLILLYPLEAQREKNMRIEEIRDLYKRNFQQQSVLRVDDPFPVRVLL